MNKTITLRELTWKKLTRYKINLGCKTLDETINQILNLITKFKLGKDLEELNQTGG